MPIIIIVRPMSTVHLFFPGFIWAEQKILIRVKMNIKVKCCNSTHLVFSSCFLVLSDLYYDSFSFSISCSLFSDGISMRATKSEELRSRQTIGREYSDGKEGKDSQRPARISPGSLINTSVNVI